MRQSSKYVDNAVLIGWSTVELNDAGSCHQGWYEIPIWAGNPNLLPAYPSVEKYALGFDDDVSYKRSICEVPDGSEYLAEDKERLPWGIGNDIF